jgi:hypothetical protein
MMDRDEIGIVERWNGGTPQNGNHGMMEKWNHGTAKALRAQD